MPGSLLILALLAPPELDRAREAERAGNYTLMQEQAEAAASACRASGDTACQSAAVNLAANAHYYRGDYDAAKQGYRQALELYRSLGDLRQQAFILNNIGGVDYVQGRYLDALKVYDDADALQAGDEAAELTLANRAALYQRLGQDRAALNLYQEIRKRRSHFSPSEEARMLTNLGALIRRLGDPVKTREVYEHALKLYKQSRDLDGELGTLKNLGILEVLEFQDFEEARRLFERVLRRARESGNRREALQSTLYLAECDFRQARWAAARAAWMQALVEAKAIRAPEEEWKAEFGLGRAAQAESRPRDARAHFEAAVRLIENLRTSLTRRSLRLDFLADKRDPYDAMIALLRGAPQPDIQELLNWLEKARARSLQDSLQGQSLPAAALALSSLQQKIPEGAAVLVLWKGQALACVSRQSAALGACPVQKLPSAYRDLIVVPDGLPDNRPVEAAPGFPVHEINVWYQPSLHSLLISRRAPPRRWPWQVEVQALVGGAPPANVKLFPADTRLEALPGAAREVAAIARQARGRTRMDDSLESADAPIVHVAAHAVADLEDPSRSRILLRQKYLLLPQIPGLDLRRVSLVTLSACETEKGRLVPGEGPQSFSRAFLLAGAESTLAALWKVDDAATAEFMRIFYSRLFRGATKAQALRAARVEFLKPATEWAKPEYWGAFVLTGAGDTQLPPMTSWAKLLTAASLLLLGVAAAIAAINRHRRRDQVSAAVSR